MSETPLAKFSLRDYSFTDFTFKDLGENDEAIDLDFRPSGKYFFKESKFVLYLSITCSLDGLAADYIKVNLKADFIFSEEELPFKDIPEYFYRNSVAIIYPYIRAFISTMTVQANTGIVMLPTLHLANLEKDLRANTLEDNEPT